MSEPAGTVTWTKLVISGVPGMECQIPTTPDGRTLDRDGDPLPHEVRTHVCNAPGVWAVGEVFVCERHAREVAYLMEDDLDEIERAWRAQL